MAISENLKRGTIELLLLTLLQENDMYGYQLSQELSFRSGGRYTLQESSMYPTLYRLLDKGVISDRKVLVGKRRTRIYYHLEPSGEVYLKQIRAEYLSVCGGVLAILGIESMEDIDEADTLANE